MGGVPLGPTLSWYAAKYQFYHITTNKIISCIFCSFVCLRLSLSSSVPCWCCSCPPQLHLLLPPLFPPQLCSLLPPWILRCCSTMKTSLRRFCPGRKDSSLVLSHLAELVLLEPGFKYSPTHLLEQTIWWLSTLILRFLAP